MRSLLSLAAKAVRCFPLQAVFALALTLLLSLCAIAQQPAVGRKRVPRLTTDDVARPAPEESTDESSKEAKPAKPEDAAKAQAGDGKLGSDEASWRERVDKARERALGLEREADEAELRITTLRNELGASGQTAKDRNQTAAEMEEAGKQLSDLRGQARAAAGDLNKLLEYGKEKSYSEAEGPKDKTDDGQPNEDFYRARYAKLKEGADTADRRIQLYDNRLRDLSQRILLNGGKDGGDNFYIMQLQQERQEVQQKLDEAREARAKAQSDLETLMEEARRAGVQPGVFR